MRDEMIAFRASPYEAKLLDALSEAYGVNRSEIMRMMIRREAEDCALEAYFKSKHADQARLFELSELIEKNSVLMDF